MYQFLLLPSKLFRGKNPPSSSMKVHVTMLHCNICYYNHTAREKPRAILYGKSSLANLSNSPAWTNIGCEGIISFSIELTLLSYYVTKIENREFQVLDYTTVIQHLPLPLTPDDLAVATVYSTYVYTMICVIYIFILEVIIFCRNLTG